MAATCIDDLKKHAQRRLPRSIYEHLEHGTYDQRTLKANTDDLERLTFAQRVLTGVGQRDLSTTVLGMRHPLPIILAPAGGLGLMARRGEAQAARAAAAANLTYCLSTTATCSIEEVKAATGVPFWFQLYMLKDRSVVESLMRRAKAAGCNALMLTVDFTVPGQRHADIRNGFSRPPRLTAANVLDMLRRWSWLRDVAWKNDMGLGNLTDVGPSTKLMTLAAWIRDQFDPGLTWDDVKWVRSQWTGPLIVKGIMSPHDARLAAEHGADAIVVSNHGGRQFDGVPSTISVLPEIVEACNGRLEVLFDGGIRSGQDVVKAIALGARACLVGRAYVYGLAAYGERGVREAIEIMRKEMSFTLAMLGRKTIADIDRSILWNGPPARTAPTAAPSIPL